MIKAKDISRHTALITQRYQDKAANEAGATRQAAISVMKESFKEGRSPQDPLTPADERKLAKIWAAEHGLIDPG